MKIKKIAVQNIKAIDYKSIDFKWCTAIIMGWNNQWKTTLLRSLYDRIVSKWMSWALRQGEWLGYSMYEFTDGSSLKREINAKGTEKFIYIDTDWIEKKSWVIKEVAEKIFWKWFDIDNFLSLPPRDQSKELERVLGIDITDLKNKYSIAYEQRADVKKNLTQYKQYTTKKDVWEYVDVTAKRLELEEIQKANEEVNQYNAVSEKSKYDIEAQVDKYSTQYDSLFAEEKKLLERLEEIKKEKEIIEKGTSECQEKYEILLAMKPKETQPIDMSILEEASEINRKISEDQEYNDKCDKRNEIAKQVNELEKLCESLLKEMDDELKKSPLPEWFVFTQDWLHYNGFPLDKKSLSTSALYIASLKLASLAGGELNTQFFDASYLDKESIESVLKRAKENGDLQLLIERPLYEWGEIQYEIIDDSQESLFQ